MGWSKEMQEKYPDGWAKALEKIRQKAREHPPMLGKKQSEYQKQRVSEALQGNQHGLGHEVTAEHRAKLAALRKANPGTNTGRKFTAEHKEKIRQANLGQKRSEETKIKIRANRAKQILPVQDTLPERMMQDELAKRGIVFEKHKQICGLPDLFITPNICIFVDGDYWHRRADAQKRDRRTNAILRAKGYRVFRVWEKQVKKNTAACVNRIIAKLRLSGSSPS
jgi:DNA mismatch endonuclease, patch repair protein